MTYTYLLQKDDLTQYQVATTLKNELLILQKTNLDLHLP